jgi:hypothetical protein
MDRKATGAQGVGQSRKEAGLDGGPGTLYYCIGMQA